MCGDMRNTFKDLVEKFDKGPLGKPRCKGIILLKIIYKTGCICIFGLLRYSHLLLKMTVMKDVYMEQPRSSTHSKIEILFYRNFWETEHTSCVDF